MEIILQNDLLTVKASLKGAEITSIKDNRDGTEYIWTGDPAFWGGQAPILFPTIGKVKNNTYRLDGKEYNLGKHGFARGCHFDVIENSNEKVLFRLASNSKTLEVFPFSFELDVKYTLSGNTIAVEYNVRNIGESSMYFSIGGHPGFNCPLKPQGKEAADTCFEDYWFEFETRETASTIRINEDGLLKREEMPFLENSAVIHLFHELFKDDALIFSNLKSNRVTLKNKKDSKGVTVDYSGFPYLGLWSQRGAAPFVCIEPWYGLADYEDFEGDIRQKTGIMELGIGKEFDCKYSITILS